MTNQLQKDIKTALSWKAFLPYEKTRHQDNEAFKRLECYINKDIDLYCKMEMKHIIEEALTNERTAIGQSVLKQLLNNIGEI